MGTPEFLSAYRKEIDRPSQDDVATRKEAAAALSNLRTLLTRPADATATKRQTIANQLFSPVSSMPSSPGTSPQRPNRPRLDVPVSSTTPNSPQESEVSASESESESESDYGVEAESARCRAARIADKVEFWTKRPSTVGGERWADAQVPPVPSTRPRGLPVETEILAPPPTLETDVRSNATPLVSPVTRGGSPRSRVWASVIAVCFAGIMLQKFRARKAAEKLKRGPSLTEKGGVVPLKWLNEIDPTAEEAKQEASDAELYQRYLKLQMTPEEDLSVSRLEALLTHYPLLWMLAPVLIGIYIFIVWSGEVRAGPLASTEL